MEELASKIAETLDISVKAAIDMYPLIRGQFIWYETLNNIMIWSIILSFISIIVIGVTIVIRDETDKYEWNTEEITDEWVSIDKVFKKALMALLIFIIIGIVSNIVVPFLAPDVVLIKNFLG